MNFLRVIPLLVVLLAVAQATYSSSSRDFDASVSNDEQSPRNKNGLVQFPRNILGNPLVAYDFVTDPDVSTYFILQFTIAVRKSL